MLDRLLDLRRLIRCGDWQTQFPRGDHLRRLGLCRANLGQELFVVHPESVDVQPLADEIALRQLDRETT